MYTSGNHINILENREIMSQSLNQMSHIQSGGWMGKQDSIWRTQTSKNIDSLSLNMDNL